MRLSPNTYTGLAFGMSYFDGIETDIRLTKDNELVIFHDTFLPAGRKITDFTLNDLLSQDIPSLEAFFSIPEIQELAKTKLIYLELKPNCNGRSRVVKPIREQYYNSLTATIERTGISKENIKLISFAKDLLIPFTEEFDCYPLIPDVNECSNRFVILKALPQVLGRSLTTELQKANNLGFSGVFFAREYIMGWTSWRHPDYEDVVEQADEFEMLLGTNLGDPVLEIDFPHLARFSDKLSQYPRFANDGEGPIIAHRGTGTKGVIIQDDDMPELTL